MKMWITDFKTAAIVLAVVCFVPVLVQASSETEVRGVVQQTFQQYNRATLAPSMIPCPLPLEAG